MVPRMAITRPTRLSRQRSIPAAPCPIRVDSQYFMGRQSATQENVIADEIQATWSSEAFSKISQGTEDQEIRKTTSQEFTFQMAWIDSDAEITSSGDESLLAPTSDKKIAAVLDAYGYKQVFSIFQNKADSSQSTSVITQQDRGLQLKNKDSFCRFFNLLKYRPNFSKAVTIIKDNNLTSADFFNTQINSQTKLYASYITTINAISEQL